MQGASPDRLGATEGAWRAKRSGPATHEANVVMLRNLARWGCGTSTPECSTGSLWQHPATRDLYLVDDDS
jgi:hypothetical protein